MPSPLQAHPTPSFSNARFSRSSRPNRSSRVPSSKAGLKTDEKSRANHQHTHSVSGHQEAINCIILNTQFIPSPLTLAHGQARACGILQRSYHRLMCDFPFLGSALSLRVKSVGDNLLQLTSFTPVISSSSLSAPSSAPASAADLSVPHRSQPIRLVLR